MGKKISEGMLYGLLSSLCSISIFIILNTWDPFSQGVSRGDPFITENPLWLILGSSIIVAPLMEEFLFRFLPINLIRRFSQNRTILWFGIIAVSALFGKLHGDWNNIFIQGSAGIIFSYCFIRGGYVDSVSAHTTSNACILIVKHIFQA